MNKKHFIISAFFLGWLVVTVSGLHFAHAATSQVSFDPDSGTLSVSGACSSNFVLVLIRRASDHSIWGSSNPNCVNGSYAYSIVVPSGERDGSNFIVAAMDADSADQSMSSMKASGTNSIAPVTFAASVPVTDITTATITIDTSSLEVAPDDTSLLNSVLQNCFGIITSALNSAEASVVAAIHLFAKIFTILPGGSITVPRGQNQISGQGTLAAGASGVFIANTSVTSSSQIIVTPTSPSQLPLAVMQITDGDGFNVGTISPQQIAVSFTWLILNTYNAGPPTQAGLQQQVSQIAPAPTISSDDSSSSMDVASDTMSIATTTDIVVPETTTTDTGIADTTTTNTVDTSDATVSTTPIDVTITDTTTDATSTTQ